MIAPPLRRARVAVALAFFLTGVVFASWASRIPAIKQDLGLGDGDLAVAFVGLNAGAIAGLQMGGILIPRTGSRPALRVALPVFAVSLIAIAFARNLATLTIALVVIAIANSVVDVAMNAHGVAVEHRYGRPILSSLHAMHPLGGMAGAGIGAIAAWLAVGPTAHFVAVAAAVVVAATVATRWLLPAPTDAIPGAHDERRLSAVLSAWFGGWSGQVIVLGTMAFCVTLAEGAALDWSAVYLHDALHTSPGLAAAGVAVFLAGLTIGRLAGDALIYRFGPVAMFRTGSLIGGLGFSLALLADGPVAGITGLAFLGAGISYLLPLLISVAGRQDGDESGAAAVVARVSTLGYLGSFVGPALIGSLAGYLGLPVALAAPALLVAGTAAVAHRIASQPHGNAAGREKGLR